MNAVAEIQTQAVETRDPIQSLNLLTRTLTKALAKVATMEDTFAEAVTAQDAAKAKVQEAMATGEGFDDASRAYKATCNKYDRLLNGRETTLKAAANDLEALRVLLPELGAKLRELEV